MAFKLKNFLIRFPMCKISEMHFNDKASDLFATLMLTHCRDFRHEKTKKKRGSYKGGIIDNQSHSIKFKDSDED